MRLLALGLGLTLLTAVPALAQEPAAPQATPQAGLPATGTQAAPTSAAPAETTADGQPRPRVLQLNYLASQSILPDGTRRHEISSSGEIRSFLVHVPRRAPRRMIPLVFSFHPAGLTAADQEAITGFSSLSEDKGFIVVYPEGRGEFSNWAWRPGEAGVQEAQFITDVITYLSRHYPINMRAVFASGMGSGAQMAGRIACVMPNTFAAVGLVAGNYPQWDDCVARPISVIAFHGTADTMMPYGGRALMMGSQGFAERMAKANDCTTGPAAVMDDKDARAIGWSTCNAATDVLFFALTNGGHGWPGSSLTPVAETSQTISATATMWEFFSHHPQARFTMPREPRRRR